MQEELRERSDYDQNTFCEIPKELIKNERKKVGAKKMSEMRKGVLCPGH